MIDSPNRDTDCWPSHYWQQMAGHHRAHLLEKRREEKNNKWMTEWVTSPEGLISNLIFKYLSNAWKIPRIESISSTTIVFSWRTHEMKRGEVEMMRKWNRNRQTSSSLASATAQVGIEIYSDMRAREMWGKATWTGSETTQIDWIIKQKKPMRSHKKCLELLQSSLGISE